VKYSLSIFASLVVVDLRRRVGYILVTKMCMIPLFGLARVCCHIPCPGLYSRDSGEETHQLLFRLCASSLRNLLYLRCPCEVYLHYLRCLGPQKPQIGRPGQKVSLHRQHAHYVATFVDDGMDYEPGSCATPHEPCRVRAEQCNRGQLRSNEARPISSQPFLLFCS
jgi:hypothetical protein